MNIISFKVYLKISANLLFLLLLISSCNSSDDTTIDPDDSTAKLNVQFEFSTTQERLDNFGNPSIVPDNHGSQTPDFNKLSVYYIELVPSKTTLLKEGSIIYEAPTKISTENNTFEDAVLFKDAIVKDEGEAFLNLSIKDIPPGTYEYLRASVTYQNGNIKFNILNLPTPLPQNLMQQNGTIASFIGFNTYIEDFLIKDKTVQVNAERQQGYWAFEPQLESPYQDLYEMYVNEDGFLSGQANAGGTTVVNPLAEFGVTLPFGSCIVTGKFEEPLTITGTETEDIKLTLSFSINKSFEWIDGNGNNQWDFDVSNGSVEPIVDMGLRGLIVKTE